MVQLLVQDDIHSSPPCKPENKEWRVLQLNWFVEFVRSIEQITIKYFETIYPDKKIKNDSVFDE